MMVYGLWDITHAYMELWWLCKDKCWVFWIYLQVHRYFYVYRPINALLVNSLMHKDIDGSRYVVPNHGYQDVVDAPEELLCFKLLSDPGLAVPVTMLCSCLKPSNNYGKTLEYLLSFYLFHNAPRLSSYSQIHLGFPHIPKYTWSTPKNRKEDELTL